MSKENNQLALFEMKEWWEDEWEGMPEFVQEDLSPWRTIYVHFKSKKDFEDFEKLIGQKVIKFAGGPGTVWYPKAKIGKTDGKRYSDIDG